MAPKAAASAPKKSAAAAPIHPPYKEMIKEAIITVRFSVVALVAHRSHDVLGRFY